jgi:hypothetical protein
MDWGRGSPVVGSWSCGRDTVRNAMSWATGGYTDYVIILIAEDGDGSRGRLASRKSRRRRRSDKRRGRVAVPTRGQPLMGPGRPVQLSLVHEEDLLLDEFIKKLVQLVGNLAVELFPHLPTLEDHVEVVLQRFKVRLDIRSRSCQ